MIFYGGKPAGTQHRNHCPNCLSSLHLDIEPGDREADCGGIMDPVGCMGEEKWGMGNYTPLPAVRTFELQPGGGG